MKHGFAKGDFRGTTLWPAPAFVMGGSGPVKIHEHQTYRLDGYKDSIVEFLVRPENIDREFRFVKNTSRDEYGTGFSDCNLHVVMLGALMSGPTTPAEMAVANVRSLAGALAGGVISDAVKALGDAGRMIVDIYDAASGTESVVRRHFNVGQRATSLASKKMYKNKLTRQIHHQFHDRIGIALQGRVDPTTERNRKVIDTGGTAITGGALAALIDEFA